MSPREYLRQLRECIRSLPGFIVERLEAVVADREQTKAEFRRDLEETRRVIRQMTEQARKPTEERA